MKWDYPWPPPVWVREELQVPAWARGTWSGSTIATRVAELRAAKCTHIRMISWTHSNFEHFGTHNPRTMWGGLLDGRGNSYPVIVACHRQIARTVAERFMTDHAIVRDRGDTWGYLLTREQRDETLYDAKARNA